MYILSAASGVILWVGAQTAQDIFARRAIGGKNSHQIYQIAYSVCLYANENDGRLPDEWSDLIPKYEDSAHRFFFGGGVGHGGFQPPDSVSREEIVDAASIYRLWKIDENTAVIYDQPGIFTDIGVSWALISRSEDMWQKIDSGFQDTHGFMKLITQKKG